MPGTSKTETSRLEKQFRHSRVLTDFEFYRYGKRVELKKKILFVTVGPPARGKSFFGKSITDKFPTNTKIFNSGSKRREKGYVNASPEFFGSKKGKDLLNEWSMETLQEGCDWLDQDNKHKYAIFDATNTTVNRRRDIYNLTVNKKNITVIFVEMLCPNSITVYYNMLMKVLSSPDYTGQIEGDIKKSRGIDAAIKNAIEDIKARNDNYLKVYKILNKWEKRKYNFVQFIVPSCTVPPQPGLIISNLTEDTWLIKHIKKIPKEIGKKTLQGYSSYKTKKKLNRNNKTRKK